MQITAYIAHSIRTSTRTLILTQIRQSMIRTISQLYAQIQCLILSPSLYTVVTRPMESLYLHAFCAGLFVLMTLCGLKLSLMLILFTKPFILTIIMAQLLIFQLKVG